VNKTLRRCLHAPGALVWRWFSGKPLDGVSRTDATWFKPATRELDPGEAPRPPLTLREEVRADLADVREEWRDLIAEIREHR